MVFKNILGYNFSTDYHGDMGLNLKCSSTEGARLRFSSVQDDLDADPDPGVH